MAREVRSTWIPRTAFARVGLAAALAMIALTVAGGARADLSAPALTLGTVTVAGGTVTLSGSVDAGAVSQANLKINGQPVAVGATGDFSAVVELDGRATLVLTLGGRDEKVKIAIPLSVLETEGEAALDALIDAGISIDVPQGGFEIIDGNQPLVTGSIANDESLSSVTINGAGVLDRLGPGGGFAILGQGASPQSGVTVVATDTRGVSQSSTFSVTRVSSVIRTRAGASVSAAGARGIVIAKVRFDKRTMKALKRLGVVVTVKDRRGFLIRGAALRLHGKPLRYLANGAARAGFTNRFGKASFTYRLNGRAFTSRGCSQLAITVRASTPTAAAKKTVRLRLPVLAPA